MPGDVSDSGGQGYGHGAGKEEPLYETASAKRIDNAMLLSGLKHTTASASRFITESQLPD
jgi:hypothetical protein